MTDWDLAEPYLWALCRHGLTREQIGAMPYSDWARLRLYTAWYDAEQIKRMRGG